MTQPEETIDITPLKNACAALAKCLAAYDKFSGEDELREPLRSGAI
jgi:hypothetical protein